jgi:cysteine-rich repeat protein
MRSTATALWTCAIVVALLVASANGVVAQPAQVVFRDGDGEWQWADVGDLPAIAPKSGAVSESIAGPFTLVYEDVEEGTGVGFDDPELGEARRETLWAVLDYLGSVLDVPGQAELLVRASQTDGTGPLASAGPLLIPESGFQGGLVFEHLVTGVDPLPNRADGTISVDFGFLWNSGTDSPAPDEHDLFTTLLHEVTHALGFLSIVASDGRSAVFNSGDTGLFSIYDSLLILEATETPVFLSGGEINATGDDFVDGDLVFAGERARDALGFYPRVFTPEPFFEGSSIGHWSMRNGFDSVMLPALGRGIERRAYTDWELQALADIGYDVIACGDGFVAGDEECDDGNLDEFDGCTSVCVLAEVDRGDAGVPEPEPDLDIGDPPAPGSPVPVPAPTFIPDPTTMADPPPSADPMERESSPPTGAVEPGAGCRVHEATGGDGAWLAFAFACLMFGRRRRSCDRGER